MLNNLIDRLKNKPVVTSIIVLVTALLLYFIFSSSGNKNLQKNIITITRGDITEKALAIGKIEPRRAIAVKSQIAGTVDDIFNIEGTFITAGAPLLSIKPTPTPRAYTDQRLDVERKRIAEQARKVDLNRHQTLIKQGFSTDNELTTAEENYRMASLELELAIKQLELLEQGRATIGDTVIESTITSPVDGFILRYNVELGDAIVPLTEAQPGTDLLTIANMDDFIFKGTVSEIDAGRVFPGMSANILIGALKSKIFSGEVGKVALAVEKKTESSSSYFNVGFEVEIDHIAFPDDISLRSGYSATADIIINQVENVVIIPERLLIFEDEQAYALIPDRRNDFIRKPITTGLTDGINIEVIEGLNEGDQVIEPTPEVYNVLD